MVVKMDYLMVDNLEINLVDLMVNLMVVKLDFRKVDYLVMN